MNAVKTAASQTEGMGGDARDLRHLKWSHMPGYGELSMDQLREAVSKAIFADRHHMGGFDPAYSKGHQSVEDINYNSLNRIVTAFVRAALTPPETAEAVPDACHADDLAVDSFSVAMKAKLADARAKGKGGWYDETECSRQYLSDELRRHALKPDPLDVANFAMFLHQRGEAIAPAIDDRERLVEALRPFANAVFNDNGDMTVSPVTDYDAYVNAYFARRAALATEASR